MYGNWINSMPSRFVDELPPAHVEVTSETGIRAGRSSHWDSSGFRPEPVKQTTYERKVQSAEGIVFSRGDRVFHEKFGTGKIINIDG
ncbi:MAG TPA: DNA helicase II, partial [Rhodospirillaceae bacterium]|nr:DNA helicase II [Rhodospirillaceae bacterium]